MRAPLVSIISPTYNHERYIAECIESVIAQTFEAWEMLIMDDGSSDGTREIAESYALKDPRVKYHYQENVGPFRLGETYNKALSLSKGEFIAILECDDVWSAEKLGKQVAILKNDPTSVLTWSKAFNSRENIHDILKVQPDEEQSAHKDQFNNDPPGIIARSLFFGNYLPALTILIRKEALLNIGGFQKHPNLALVDHPTLLHLCWQGKFHFDDSILGTYRRHGKQITKKYALESLESMNSYLLHYFDSLDSAQKKVLNMTKDNIIALFHTREMAVRSVYARRCLTSKDFKEAREEYSKVILYPHTFNALWRLRSLVGWTLSFLKLDVEWLAKILGKRYYK